MNFLSHIFLQIYPSSCGKSCLKCISQQKIRFGCWVAPSRPPDPYPYRTSPAKSGLAGKASRPPALPRAPLLCLSVRLCICLSHLRTAAGVQKMKFGPAHQYFVRLQFNYMQKLPILKISDNRSWYKKILRYDLPVRYGYRTYEE